MTTRDLEMAVGSARYLRRNGLRPDEVRDVLTAEFGCTPGEARIISTKLSTTGTVRRNPKARRTSRLRLAAAP